MDFIEKGKKLAQDGNYEEALDAFLLALENDKENPDVHFYLGLCHSSLEQFGYAKYHYQMALSLNPEHEKTKMVWDGIKDVTPEKPPEKRATRSAAQKALKEQQPEAAARQKESQPATKSATAAQESELEKKSKTFKVTEDKWEKAFPSDTMPEKSKKEGSFFSWVIALIGIAIIGYIVYYLLINYF